MRPRWPGRSRIRLRPKVDSPLAAATEASSPPGSSEVWRHRIDYRRPWLFKLAQLQGIADGTIDLQFRRWDRPRARAGGRQMTAVGVIRIDDVRVVRRVTKAEARRAGFETPEAVVRALRPDGDLYRIELHLEGPDPRVALRERSRPATTSWRSGAR